MRPHEMRWFRLCRRIDLRLPSAPETVNEITYWVIKLPVVALSTVLVRWKRS